MDKSRPRKPSPWASPQSIPGSDQMSKLPNDLFREIGLVWLAINLIESAPRRVRRALKSHQDNVLRAIEKFGFRIPILVRSKPGTDRYEVIDGHTRLAAALRLGAEKVPCIVVDDLSDVETRRLPCR